jgi:precorrin-4 methylase
MAQQYPTIEFQDIPLKDARTMGRGPRMDPFLYQALKSKIHSLAETAARMNLPEGVNATTMKNRILRVAAELKVLVTVHRVSGGVVFWRSTDEDLKQAKEVAMRLQAAQRKGRARHGRRRRA